MAQSNFFTRWLEAIKKTLAKTSAGPTPEPPIPAPLPIELWQDGREGEDVKLLQKQLTHLGHEIEGGVDGVLGPHTREAVEDFQEGQEVTEAGIGPKTLNAIGEAYAALLVPPDLVLEMGDSGTKVRVFQEKLISLDHELPRFGADGGFGDETLVAIKEFQAENPTKVGEENAFASRGVGPLTYAAVMAATPLPVKPSVPFVPPPVAGLPFSPPPGMIVTKDLHPVKKGKGTRQLRAIKGATLHQTATILGEDPSRWAGVACHIGITRSGKIIYNVDFTKIIWHGNGFNDTTIGIEIDGHFAGLEELNETTGIWTPDLTTYWRPASTPDRKPLTVTPAQIEACKQVLRWVQRLIAGDGGNLTHLLAHRQSSASRRSDPGEKIWKMVAVPMLDELKLTDGGDGYYILDSKGLPGKPLPTRWDPKRHAAVPYKMTPKKTAGHPRKGP